MTTKSEESKEKSERPLSRAQKFIKWLFPKRFPAMMEESKRYKLICKTCSYETSYWDIGGIRYKAYSKGKTTWLRCPQCAKTKQFRTEKR
jgi:hypothetical protein